MDFKSLPLILAFCAALAEGVYFLTNAKASKYAVGGVAATLISFVAMSIGALFWFPSIRSTLSTLPTAAFWWIGFAGVSAFAVDFLVIESFRHGMPIHIGAPLVTGVGIMIAVVLGIFFGEEVTAMKALGILSIILGSVLLVR